MARVVILGNTPSTRFFLRQGLGVQQIEIVGFAPGADRDHLPYAIEYGSGTSRFKGTAEIQEDVLVLAGRYGRGGLRHDRIPLLDAGTGDVGGPAPDVVVLSEDWEGRVPAGLLKSSPRLIGFGGVPHMGELDLVRVRPAPLWAVQTIVSALYQLSEVTSVSVTSRGGTSGLPSRRSALLAARGDLPGQVCHPWTATLDPGIGVLGTDVVEESSDRVTTSVLHVTLEQKTGQDQVLRRLKSAARRARLDLRTGPVGGRDASGLPSVVIDLSAVQVDARSITVPFFCDSRTVEAALACDLVTAPV